MSGFRAVDVKNPASLSVSGVSRVISGDARWCGYWMVLEVGESVVCPGIP
mgnify:CR=1 FL=1